MEKEIEQLTALAHPQRLAVFRLLMRRYPGGVPAGEIGEVLGVKPSTLSAYLASLVHAGLITQERQGTSLRYAAALAQAQALTGFLIDDCCRGRVGVLVQDRPAARIRNVLFLCIDNSALSLMAEAILRERAGERFEVFSAGAEAVNQPDPEVLALLQGQGHDVSCLWSKPASLFRADDAPRMDFVLTLSNCAANCDQGAWVGHPVHGHWSTPLSRGDPLTGATSGALAQAYAILHRRIGAFAELSTALSRSGIQRGVDDIALLGPTPLNGSA